MRLHHLLPLLVLVACQPGTDDTVTSVPDMDTGTLTEPTGGADGGDADYQALAMCEPEVCDLWAQNYAEGAAYGPTVHADCVLAGLRDGTPGRYRYLSDHEFGNGHIDTDTIFVVHPGREVSVVTKRVHTLESEPENVLYDPPERCTLWGPETFSACIDIMEPINCAWLDESSWWTNCTNAAPSC